MKNIISQQRRCGILAHISSLPSRYGIGDIGPASISFLDFLADAGQSCWQFLPLSQTSPAFDNSPYMSSSAFAGSPLLISPDLLVNEGLIEQQSLEALPEFSIYQTEYDKVRAFKQGLLAEAFARFSAEDDPRFDEYRAAHAWTEDYGLFMALKEHFNDKGWFEWPRDIATRKKSAVQRYRELCRNRIDYYIFEQYIFYHQWQQLHRYARQKNILLFGDIPIYVGLDSVDVWANQEIFDLDRDTGMPTMVAGVPPDYFSATGQRWGNPLYRWNTRSKRIASHLDQWWIARFRAIYDFVDIARIDHFRGFESYWAIPAEYDTAEKGEWLPGPGAGFFQRMSGHLGPLDIVAEDLGIITDKVHELRDELGYPGMKVLQFAFDGTQDNTFLPHNFTTSHCVVYTGTHDNDTTVGWFLSQQLDDRTRELVKHHANRHLHDESGIHDDLIYLAYSSTASLAIVPLQDILGFGSDCRMNTPGVPTGNWRWRCSPEFLTTELAGRTARRAALFSRDNPMAETR